LSNFTASLCALSCAHLLHVLQQQSNCDAFRTTGGFEVVRQGWRSGSRRNLARKSDVPSGETECGKATDSQRKM